MFLTMSEFASFSCVAVGMFCKEKKILKPQTFAVAGYF